MESHHVLDVDVDPRAVASVVAVAAIAFVLALVQIVAVVGVGCLVCG